MQTSKRFAKVSMELQKKRQKYSDDMLKEIWGCYSNIRFVKMEALEDFFLSKIFAVKLNHLAMWIRKFLNEYACMVINNGFSILLMISLFGFYIYFGNVLTVASLFTILQILTKFQYKIGKSSELINSVTSCWVSVLRLNTFFVSEEIDLSLITYYDKKIELSKDQDEQSNQEYSIEIKNGNFHWIDQKQVKYLEEQDALEKMKKNKKFCMSMKKVQENHN